MSSRPPRRRSWDPAGVLVGGGLRCPLQSPEKVLKRSWSCQWSLTGLQGTWRRIFWSLRWFRYLEKVVGTRWAVTVIVEVLERFRSPLELRQRQSGFLVVSEPQISRECISKVTGHLSEMWEEWERMWACQTGCLSSLLETFVMSSRLGQLTEFCPFGRNRILSSWF